MSYTYLTHVLHILTLTYTCLTHVLYLRTHVLYMSYTFFELFDIYENLKKLHNTFFTFVLHN